MSDLPVPGTVHQVDLYGTLSNVRHNGKDIILIPQPSSDPDDPLNWTTWRRRHYMFWLMAWCFVGTVIISSLSPANLLIEKDTGISVADINTGTGIQYLFFGWSNVIIQPLALNWGRRPVLLVSMLGTSLLMLWTTRCTSAGEWWANRVLIGIFMAPVETLVEVCIADTQFSHVRGFAMGWYTWTLFNGAFLGPIAAGFVADRYGWRWIQYICCIIGCACFTFMFFLFEESMFFRPDATEAELIGELPGENTPVQTTDTESKTESKSPAEGVDSASPSETEMGEHRPTTKTFLQRMALWGLRNPRQPSTFVRGLYLPFYLCRFPVMVYSGLLVGSILAWFNVVNGTIPTILGGPPYNFSADMLGVIYISPVIGVSFGCYFSGWMSDQLADRLARRNKGIKEPEHRLWVAVIPLILHPAGCILYGVGAAHNIHWVGVAFGLALISCCMPMGSSVAFNYIIDSYGEVAGEGLVTAILFRNTIGKLAW
jgi:MFS family permease